MKIEKAELTWRQALTLIKKVDTLVCHHPAHPSWGLYEIHDYHKNTKGWNGIGYNYFITFDGEVFEGRGKNIGAHCEGHNSNTLGICFQGDFDKQQMTDKQVEAGGWLIALLIREYGLSINDIKGHKEMKGASTACPGKNFRMTDLKQSVLEWTNPSVKKEVAGVIYQDSQPPQKFRLKSGVLPEVVQNEKLEEFKKDFPELAAYARLENKTIVTGTWTNPATAQEYKDKIKQKYGWWVYIEIV